MKIVELDSGRKFMGCTGYRARPACKFTEALDLNAARVERDLRAARDDMEWSRAWLHLLKRHMSTHVVDCIECQRHIAELERGL